MPAPSQVSVVDEDETLREAICRAIRVEKHRATAYGDGAAAREAFERTPPECVVLSLAIPGTDGREFCRSLRQRSPQLPIVAVVRRENDMEDVLALNLGA